MRTATGSALIEAGGTRVICTASVDEEVPRWMRGKGRGWVTAEYGMLPASTGERKQRDVSKGRPDGRTVEIQRLIGRSLRGVVDFEALGERTVWIDCDVLEADGGTRCAAITGGYVALELALRAADGEGLLDTLPLDAVGGGGLLRRGRGRGRCSTSTTPEDSTAEVDMNVVMTGDGGLVEVQATAERTPLSRASLDELLELAAAGIERLRAAQRERRRRGCQLTARRAARARLPQRAQAARARACCWRRTSWCRCPTRCELPPETGATFADNALGKARAAAGAHRARRRWPTTPASRRPRSAARRACTRPATRARAPATRRTWPSCCARCPPDGDTRVAYVCALASWARAAPRRSSRGAARAR